MLIDIACEGVAALLTERDATIERYRAAEAELSAQIAELQTRLKQPPPQIGIKTAVARSIRYRLGRAVGSRSDP